MSVQRNANGNPYLLDCTERITHIESVQELFSNEDQRHTMKQIFDTLKKFEKV